MKKLKKLKLIIIALGLSITGFVLHDYLANTLKIFPNPGVSFGVSGNFLLGVAFLALVIVIALFWRREDWALMIVAVGGVINFVDRMIFGYVRDYWNFGWFYNNLADLIIVFGVLCSGLLLWRKR